VRDPFLDLRQTRPDAVDVPGRELHRLSAASFSRRTR
jgi:hypothetical protein